MRMLTSVVGYISDPSIEDLLVKLESVGRVFRLPVSATNLGRRRFRVADQYGNRYGIAIPREQELQNGSILYIDDDQIVVVDTDATPTLIIKAKTISAGLQLGWAAGHLHWKTQIKADQVHVLLEGSEEEYLRRLRHLLDEESIEVLV